MPFITEENLHYIGEFALEIMANEYCSYLQQEEVNICVWCILRQQNNRLTLPCRHVFQYMSEQFIIISALAKSFLKEDIFLPQNIDDGILETFSLNREKSYNYTDIMSKLAPYASTASKNQNVQMILNETFEKLESTKINIGIGMPPTLTQKGRFKDHPSKNNDATFAKFYMVKKSKPCHGTKCHSLHFWHFL